MISQTRRDDEHRNKFLDASLVPLERALLHKSIEYGKKAEQWNEPETTLVLNMLSVAFSELAEELHHW